MVLPVYLGLAIGGILTICCLSVVAGVGGGALYQDARTASNDKASNEQIKNEILLIPPNISILIGFKQFKMH